MVQRIRRTVIDVKGNTQVGHVVFQQLMVFIYNGPGVVFFLHGLYGDGGAMFVAAAYEYHIFAVP